LADKDSLKLIERDWIPFLASNNIKTYKILVGLKSDIKNIDKQKIEEFKSNNSIEKYFETSSKKDTGIKELFDEIANKFKDSLKDKDKLGWEYDNDSISIFKSCTIC
jgi:tRNA U34 5-carboxymethylaminomethyl modifying GTPase MnmE/TrmE